MGSDQEFDRVKCGYESALAQPFLIVTGGNRQAKRRAIEANEYLSVWRQALETECRCHRLLPGPLPSQEGFVGVLTGGIGRGIDGRVTSISVTSSPSLRPDSFQNSRN